MTVLVLITVPGVELGEAIARTLVAERLAACVSVSGPITSLYRWQGAVERATEYQVVIKTVAERVSAVQSRVGELHPYELPEFLVLEAAGSADYLGWIRAQTAGSGDAEAR